MTRAPRIDVNMPAVLVAADGQQTAVTIMDLSAEGFRLEHSEDLLPGDNVSLILQKGELVAARIKWSLGREAGGVFLSKPRSGLN